MRIPTNFPSDIPSLFKNHFIAPRSFTAGPLDNFFFTYIYFLSLENIKTLKIREIIYIRSCKAVLTHEGIKTSYFLVQRLLQTIYA